jgi:acetylornithine deacetylase/succinyl-diaminopimelate desuccinylase-like protein
VILRGPSIDLHSGHYGGCILNPINELTKILAQLHDDDRRITIPNFYDNVRPLADEQRKEWQSLDFDEHRFLRHAGFERGAGEAGFSTLERQWARPTCDINGIKGGYIGEGAKTVIATHASAKVSFRLVPNQEPHKTLTSFRLWLRERVPDGCTLELLDHGMGRPYEADVNSPYMDIAKQSLATVFNKQPVLIGCGGSIPIVDAFKSVLGLDSLLVGFGLEDDRVHSPNEKFEVICFDRGIQTHAVLLGLASQAARS